MRTTTPPRDGVPAPGGGWGVRRVARMAYPDPAARALDPAYATDLGVYLADMLGPHGLALDPAALKPAGQAYDEMARALIGRIVPEGEQVELLVLAYAIPDITPGRSAAVRLSHDCPGVPMAFAISDQGAAAAFTALRLIRQYAATGEARRALLIVLEQAWLPYEPPLPAAVPAGHSAVALLFGDTGDMDDTRDRSEQSEQSDQGDRTADLAQRPARLGPIVMRSPAAASALADALSALSDSAPDESTAIIGTLLASRAADLPGHANATGLTEQPAIRRGSAARPYTGVWWELADELSRPHAEPRRLVVADYDPDSLTLCLAALDVGDPAAAAAPSGQRQARETT